jgi:hypothetical protein
MRLWISILITPIAALTQLSANYALVALECEKQQRFPIHLVSGITLAIGVIGVLLAWSVWREAGMHPPDDRGEAVSRVRFLAALGAAISALMVLSMGAQWLTTGFVTPCLQ